MVEEQSKETPIADTQKIKPINEGLKQMYIEKLNHEPISSYDDYKNKHIRIFVGKELLPDGNKEIYDKAKNLLKKHKPSVRDTSFDYHDLGDKQLPIYTIKASDAGKGEAEPLALKEVLNDIKDQQWEHHSAELQEIDDEILNVLKKKGIIKTDDKSLDSMKNEIKKSFLSGITGEGEDAVQ